MNSFKFIHRAFCGAQTMVLRLTIAEGSVSLRPFVFSPVPGRSSSVGIIPLMHKLIQCINRAGMPVIKREYAPHPVSMSSRK